MKIAEVISDLDSRAGAEVFFVSLCRSFMKDPDVDLYIIVLWDKIDETFEEAISSFGDHFYTCHKKKGISFSAAKELKKILNKVKPDVVHTHMSVLPTYFLAFGFSAESWWMVHTCHNIADKEASKVKRILRKGFLRNKKFVHVGISDSITASIIKEYGNYFVPTIYNGIEFNHAIRNAEFKYDFISVARFYPQKNHKLLFDAFNILIHKSEQCKNALLLCLGDGPQFGEDIEYIKTISLENNVIFMGSVSDVYSYLCESKIFVISSTYEGNPISLLEALNAGMPVISTRVGGIPDIITDGKNGYLVDDFEPLTFAEKMEQLISSPSAMGEMSRNNVVLAKKYNIDECRLEYCSLFKKLLYCGIKNE